MRERVPSDITLKSSSLADQVVRGTVVNTDDALAPAALALRSRRAEIHSGPDDGSPDTLTIPLRGSRRALGAVVFEGVRIDGGGELDLLERAANSAPTSRPSSRMSSCSKRA